MFGFLLNDLSGWPNMFPHCILSDTSSSIHLNSLHSPQSLAIFSSHYTLLPGFETSANFNKLHSNPKSDRNHKGGGSSNADTAKQFIILPHPKMTVCSSCFLSINQISIHACILPTVRHTPNLVNFDNYIESIWKNWKTNVLTLSILLVVTWKNFRFVKHNFPFMNSCWLWPIVALFSPCTITT